MAAAGGAGGAGGGEATVDEIERSWLVSDGDATVDEIERSWLVSDGDGTFVTHLAGASRVGITQAYLAMGDGREVRTRRKTKTSGTTWEITTKVDTDDALERKETTVGIGAAGFDKLLAAAGGWVIDKCRYVVDLWDGLKAEVDVYHRPCAMATVEVEFPDRKSARAFVPPLWFGPEVTESRWARNASLARSAPAEIESNIRAAYTDDEMDLAAVERTRAALESMGLDVPASGAQAVCIGGTSRTYRTDGGCITFWSAGTKELLAVGCYIPPHRHPSVAETFTVVAGSVNVIIDGDEHLKRPGDVFEVPAGALHSLRACEPSEDPRLFNTFVLRETTTPRQTEFEDGGRMVARAGKMSAPES